MTAMAGPKAKAEAKSAPAKPKVDEIEVEAKAESKDSTEIRRQMVSMRGYLKHHSTEDPVVLQAFEALL